MGNHAVTVIARHDVERGKEEAYTAWINGITDACRKFPGYLGSELISPHSAQSTEHVSIFRFDHYKNLKVWMDSPERKSWLKRTSEYSQRPVEILCYRSIEFWFTGLQELAARPPRYKMALITFAVIWPMVHYIPRALAWVAGEASLATEVLSVSIIILLMTYAAMPAMTWLFKSWLTARSQPAPSQEPAPLQKSNRLPSDHLELS